MKIKEFLEEQKKTLETLDLELFLMFVLNKDKTFIFLNQDFEVWNKELKVLYELIEKRKRHFSVAVLTWEKEFYWRRFFVNKNVLVPRPETEILISEILKEIKEWEKVLDIWTGSWIIPITLCLEIKDLKMTALDISDKALEVAKKNAEKFWVKINFIESDLLKNIDWKFDILTANLPYVENSYFDKSISKEPNLALYSWKDWLDHYRRLFEELKKWKVDFNFLFLEMADFQTTEVARLFSFFWKTEIIKDLNGQARIVKVSKI